jgi:hypothetical protein
MSCTPMAIGVESIAGPRTANNATRNLLFMLAIWALVAMPCIAVSQENCNTALSRIARREADKAIATHLGDACSGLKSGSIAVDKTKLLELRSFRLCENGPLVTASVTVRVKCGTSDQALIRLEIEDDLTATASANLDTCQVLDARISAGGSVAEAGLRAAGLSKKLHDAAQNEIKPYCK